MLDLLFLLQGYGSCYFGHTDVRRTVVSPRVCAVWPGSWALAGRATARRGQLNQSANQASSLT